MKQKSKGEKKQRLLDYKTLDSVGVVLRFRLDTILCHLPDDNLNKLKNISLKCALRQC